MGCCPGEHIFVWFTLDESLEGGEAAATVTDYAQGREGDEPGDTGPITVHDPDGEFPRGIATAKGMAVYNDRTDQWRVDRCEQVAESLLGEVVSIDGVTVTIENLIPLDGLSPEVDEENPFEANDYFAQGPEAGDKVFIKWNKTNSRYECWKPGAVAGAEIDVVYGLRYDTGKVQIATKTVKVIEEVSDNSWQDAITLETQSAITDVGLNGNNIAVKTKAFTAFAVSAEGAFNNKISLGSISVVVDCSVDVPDLMQQKRTDVLVVNEGNLGAAASYHAGGECPGAG